MLFIKYNNRQSASEVFVVLVLGLVSGYFALRYDSDPEHCFYTEITYDAMQPYNETTPLVNATLPASNVTLNATLPALNGTNKTTDL